MNGKKQIKEGVVWTTFANLTNAIYGFVAVPILISYFGKAEYGLIGLAMSINVYIQLMDMGLNSTNVRFYSTWLAQKKYVRLADGFQTSLSFYSIVGAINAFILLIVSCFSRMIFNVSDQQDIILKHLLYILAFSAFCNWFSSCFDQLIKATENIAWIQKRTLFTKILMIVVLCATVWLKLSIECYYILTCLATIVIVPLSVGKIKKVIPFISFLPKWKKEAFKEMLPYMMNIFSFGLFQFSFYNLRPVFLGIQGSIESVADYRILNGIIGVVTMIGGAFTGVLLPSVSRVVVQNNRQAFLRVAYDGTKYISVLLCFCCFGMMSVGSNLISLYVGDSYLYLIPWFNLWLLCTLGNHNQAISSLILAGSDIRAISYNSIFASILGLVSAWILIPYYNIGGVCIAYVIYILIQLIFYYIYYWPKVMKINSFRIFKQAFAPYCLIGALCYYLSSYMDLSNIVWLDGLFKGIIFSVLFGVLTYLTFSKEDKKFLFTKK